MIPVTPFLILFGSRMLLDLWDTVSLRLSGLRPLLAAGLFLLLAATGFYAVAYTAVYEREHPAIRTGRWINTNAPKGSVILKEHWEEAIPGLHGYEIREMPIYDPDTEAKLAGMAEELALADYVVFYSNRLYGTIPRLPDRYPFSSEYYRLLFSGALGYELADVRTSYPGLAGVTFVDDTLSRPGVPSPGRLLSGAAAGLVLNMGFADESFTVYDHPMTLVFENRRRLTAGEIEQALGVGKSVDLRMPGLMLSADQAAAQRAGGTWSEIVRPESWPARLPVLSWLLVVELMSLLAVPIAFVLLRRLPDRGYLLAKPLGLLLVCLVVWLLASYELLAFSVTSIGVGMAVIAAVSLALLAARWREVAAFVARRWGTLLAGEAVFLAAFLAFVLVRMANPDLWHSHLGGEKPMDMAYLNAVLKSSYMPPYDPWFGGGYINYYYWGQFMVATLIRATGIDPAIAFNLAVPLFFALTAAAAYSIVYNLASATHRSGPPTVVPSCSEGPGAGACPEPVEGSPSTAPTDDAVQRPGGPANVVPSCSEGPGAGACPEPVEGSPLDHAGTRRHPHPDCPPSPLPHRRGLRRRRLRRPPRQPRRRSPAPWRRVERLCPERALHWLRLLAQHARHAARPARPRDNRVPLLHLPVRRPPCPPHGPAIHPPGHRPLPGRSPVRPSGQFVVPAKAGTQRGGGGMVRWYCRQFA